MSQEQVDAPERIAGWLRGLDITSAKNGVSEISHDIDGREDKIVPITPTRLERRLRQYNEVSPTDTSFSGASIFDDPKHQASSSPCPGGRFRENRSEITSIDGEALDLDNEKLHLRLIAREYPRSRSTSLSSIDPPSHASSIEHNIIDARTTQTFAPQDPSIPRIVCISSCLQCILSDLPCSRTLPACSRCKRKGQGDLCLLHRRWFYEELNTSDNAQYGVPILLKVRGEDESIWKRKVELRDELHAIWLAQQDRKNWVLPDIHAPQCSYSLVGRGAKVLHPGEGKGQVTFAQLCVDLDKRLF